MKLDTKAMRHLTPEDWRVLTAVEMGSKNHEIVPTPLIEKIARLRGGNSGVHKSISNLAKNGLIGRVKEAKYDGYRLTYGGLDYLAMHTYSSRKEVYSVGSRVGVGKESDIVMVADNEGRQRILKIHRLGRISFRTVKTNRDYLRRRQGGSWMYLSRLSATKEYAFMRALREDGFPVPEPIAQSRHTVVMSFVDSYPLRQIMAVPDPASLYAELIAMILRLAQHGLIHGDFNEFNILIKEEADQQEEGNPEDDSETPADSPVRLIPVLIDFPQMVSMDHQNAEMYFDRDVNCVKRFFERKFHFTSTEPGPFYKDAKKTVGQNGARRIDVAVEASGFTKKMSKELEAAIQEQAASKAEDFSGSEGLASEDEDEEEEEEDDDDDDAHEEGLEEDETGRDTKLHDSQDDSRGGATDALQRLEIKDGS